MSSTDIYLSQVRCVSLTMSSCSAWSSSHIYLSYIFLVKGKFYNKFLSYKSSTDICLSQSLMKYKSCKSTLVRHIFQLYLFESYLGSVTGKGQQELTIVCDGRHILCSLQDVLTCVGPWNKTNEPIGYWNQGTVIESSQQLVHDCGTLSLPRWRKPRDI